ncbi:MAG: glycoside hydrolase family 57 protein [bacterium]
MLENHHMYTDKPLHVAVLWHHHQPFYKDLITKKYAMPWVRLHAIKDYYDMAAILDEYPKIHLNFNLVPSLLVQLEDYAAGTAVDPQLELTLTKAAQLTLSDKTNILRDFFMANWKNMIEPHPRYHKLLQKRGRYANVSEFERISSYFSTQDFLDLQVWFNLSWMDPYWRKTDPFIKHLYTKTSRFTEKDKITLIEKHREICGKVIQKYIDLQDNGQIEITTSPFYHPIMPLVCDTSIARESSPYIKLPAEPFDHPEDVDHQIAESVDYYQKVFGIKPKGMWPSEGSVSESIIPFLLKHGFSWIATDEGILSRSLSQPNISETLYKPYKIHNTNPPFYMLFRHQKLSDEISFNYAGMDPSAAADNLIHKLHHIRSSLNSIREDNIILLALDGENCWEYFKNDGEDFLNAFYAKLSEEKLLPTVKVSEYVNNSSAGTLKKIWPGSWINSNFNIWIGHREDNAAWDYLTKTRQFLVEHLASNPQKNSTPESKKAWETIYIAEGSDWNWWYGDEHSTSSDEEFDALYRKHLMNTYTLMNERIPDWLYVAIKKSTTHTHCLLPPVDLIAPKIDGKVTNYYEWHSAGFYKVLHAGGTMYKSECILSSFHYGFSLDDLFFRLDLKIPLQDALIKTLTFKIVFLKPSKKELIIKMLPKGTLEEYGLFSSEPFIKIKDIFSFAAVNIVEFSVPFNDLDNSERFPIEFMIVVEKDLIELERWPLNSSVTFEKPTETYKLINWSA